MAPKHTLLAALLLLSFCVSAQHSNDTAKPKIFKFVEQMPSSGYNIGEYLGSNIHYPDSSRHHHMEGRVIVKFIVDEEGNIGDCQLVRGIDKYCDAEAIRVVSNMPRWKPGRQNGKPVPVWFTLPIVFKLQ